MRRGEWKPPPGWPLPTPGWSPPVGWQPDPSWPPVPEAWQWWQPTRRSRRQRLVLGSLVAIPVVAILALAGTLVAAENAYERAGCGSIDPTDEANYSRVTIVNDTAGSVVVDDCAGAECHAYRLPVRLSPGQRFADHAACAASGIDMTSWRLTGGDGTVLGYIAVDTPRSQDGLRFLVSQASADRVTPTPPLGRCGWLERS